MQIFVARRAFHEVGMILLGNPCEAYKRTIHGYAGHEQGTLRTLPHTDVHEGFTQCKTNCFSP